MRQILVLVAATLWLIPVANADNGVLEINQACVSVGCFSGDGGGFPVSIDGSAGSSYRLTSDLAVQDVDQHGIVVSVDDITIDLNGFAIRGPVTCSGDPLTCSPASGEGAGIRCLPVDIAGTSVQNGSVSGMGGTGVYLALQSEVTNMRVRSNAASGIIVRAGSTVSGNTVRKNGVIGIFANQQSTISGNVAYQNGDSGIYANAGSIVLGNTANSNGDNGVFASSGSTVTGNTTFNNDGNGISVGPGSTVSGNTARQNKGYGLHFFNSVSGYSENVISTNAQGTIGGGFGVEFGENLCDGNTTCP